MHMDTAPVARDIIEIFERHGEWREKEAERLLASSKISGAEAWDVRARTAYHPSKEMVQYWGFVRLARMALMAWLTECIKSYGTILGATLAAMYPERIKRAVLDGVADSHDCTLALAYGDRC